MNYRDCSGMNTLAGKATLSNMFLPSLLFGVYPTEKLFDPQGATIFREDPFSKGAWCKCAIREVIKVIFCLKLTIKGPRKILEQTTIYFCFLFFRENNAWHYMWIVCQADDSHVMSSIIFSKKYEKHALRMSSAGHDWHLKG